jgi:hypothetical protein
MVLVMVRWEAGPRERRPKKLEGEKSKGSSQKIRVIRRREMKLKIKMMMW